MKTPKVSVIIPNYNHAPYLRERFESILTQTYKDFELLILDDGSTDDSYQIIGRYERRARVRVLVNNTNSGSAFSQWNLGISLARGEYVWIAESDDSADPHFLETVVPLLDENPSLGLAYCQSTLIDSAGLEIGNSLNWTSDLDDKRWQADFRNNGRDEIRNYLIFKNTIPNASAVIVRRTVLEKVMPVDTSFKLCGDWMHWGKMLLQTNLAYIAERLNRWRLGSSNSRLLPPGIMEWNEGRRVVRHLATALGYSDSEQAQKLLAFAERCMSWRAA